MLSLVFWSLVLVISVKYLSFVMRADNRGEGGILALMALVRSDPKKGRRSLVVISLGLFGAALLYGDGMLTPAISVLSALEGLNVATEVFEPFVIPLTAAVLIALFMVQSRGTSTVGAWFGPVTLLWFLSLAILGAAAVAREPSVLVSIDPRYAFQFFSENGWRSFLILGTVFLVVTGGEALYADMGHFGRRPIRFVWFGLVLPALLLNYFGQGALLIRDPLHARNPFYLLVPSWGLYPMVILATAATIIASQAVISGAFSLTRQAIQLGYAPRMRIEHTSPEEIGQIYVPAINWGIMLATIALVLEFRSSSNLAAAYGMAVSSTMVITTLLAYVVTRQLWGWSLTTSLSVTALFLTIDLAFLGANLIKVPNGGWFPLLIGTAGFISMSTWKRGREILRDRLRARVVPLEIFLRQIEENPPVRLQHPAVFMSGDPWGTPPALVYNLIHNEVLHLPVVLLTIGTEEVPHVPEMERLEIETLGADLYRVMAHYGFMQHPSVLAILSNLRSRGLDLSLKETTFFLGRETLIATRRPGMAIWREKLFSIMSRNALASITFFRIPPDRVIEVGVQIEL